MRARLVPTSVWTLHGDDQQPQIVFGYALEHVFERARQRQSDAGLLEHGAEFAAQRIGEFLRPRPAGRGSANGRLRART